MMPLDQQQFERLKLNYSDVFGREWDGGFYCPILAEHGEGARGLLNGHILNEAVANAPRITVVQRKDIDNYYGHTIEPDAIQFLNMQQPDIAKLMQQKRRGMTAVDSEGNEFKVAFGNGKAELPFPRLNLTRDQRDMAGDVHVKTAPDDRVDDSVFNLRLKFTVSHAAIVGSMIKAAYLTLFELLGYALVKETSLDPIRSVLASFYRDGAPKEEAEKYFGKYEGAFNALSGSDVIGLGDSILNRMFLGHFDDGGLFAKSVLLKANGLTYAVTVPWTWRDEGTATALQRYNTFLTEKTHTHLVKPMQYLVDEHRFDILPIDIPHMQ